MTVTNKFRDEFIQWAVSQGSTISPLLSIKNSSLGGTGVFLSLQKLDDELDPKGHLEVMRVPKKLTVSLDSFSDMLLVPQQSYDDEILAQDMLKQSQVVVKFLSVFSESFENQVDPFVRGGISETNILVGQIQMLVILKKIRDELTKKDAKKYGSLNESPFAKLDMVWELLDRTEVPALTVDQYYDKFFEVHKYVVREYRQRIERIRYDAIYTALGQLDEVEVDWKSFVNDDLLRKIELSVISRLLEIPERIPAQQDDTNEETGRYDKLQKHTPTTDPRTVYVDPDSTIFNSEADTSQDEKAKNPTYGFSVSSTIVPLVDFVNHSNDYLNAFFDVEPETGDVLLRLLNDKVLTLAQSAKEEVEVFIRYSDYEDTLKFAYAYGFIPRSHNVRPLFEMSIDRDFVKNYTVSSEVEGVKYEHDLGLLLKWLHVQPSVQFVLGYDSKGELIDVKMNLDENFIVFGFVKGMKYYKEGALAIVKFYSELQDDEYIEKLLELEEGDENDLIGGYDVIPYTCVYVKEEEQVNLMEIVEGIPDDEVDQLMLRFLKFFHEYATYRLEIINKALKDMSQGESIVRDYTTVERDILEVFSKIYTFAESDEAKTDLIIGSEDVDEEWLSQRLRPRTVAAEKRADLYMKYASVDEMAEGIQGLDIGQ